MPNKKDRKSWNYLTGSEGIPRLKQLNRFIAAAIGIVGVGISNGHAQQVALLDSGVDSSRGFNIAPGFNYYTNSADTSDTSDRAGEGHGTVSVRVASEAFSGQIVPFVITDGDLTRRDEARVRSARDSALADILGRDAVRVVGFTWGTDGITGTAAPLMADLSRADKVVAIMAGNEFSAQPNALATSSFNLSGVIIVGATDGDGVLLPESNRAGSTAQRYVAAIGLPSANATQGGTSWATARISGIAGAVLLQNPNLSAQEVVDVILQSAEDRGAAGTDDVYGRGVILNAQQVLNNVIGTPTVPTDPTPPETGGGGGGGGGGGAGALLLVGGALAGALLLSRRSSTKLEKTLVLDSYGRGFGVDLNDQVQINDGVLHLNQFFNSLEQTQVNSGITLPGLKTQVAFSAAEITDPRFDAIEYFALPGDVGVENRDKTASLALRSQLSSTLALNAGYRVNPASQLGAARDLEAHSDFGVTSFLTGESFSSVLSGFSRQADAVSFDYTPGNKKTSLKAGFVSVNDDERYNQESLSTLLQGSYQFNDRAGLSLKFGQIEEQGSVLGGGGAGVFGVDESVTYAIDVSGKISATEKISLVANYGIGRTRVDASEQSLLSDFSTLKSDWYSLGLIGNNLFRSRDQLGFAFSQPIKINSGDVTYAIPTSRLADGGIGFDTERVNLSETNATEKNLEAYYRTMVTDKLELGGFMSYRQNPNHVSDFGNDAIVMATLRFWK